MFENKFRKFNGEVIKNPVNYIEEILKNQPKSTIAVGCDSVQRSKKTIYAITIMIYNADLKRGAHIIYYKESLFNVKDYQDRLYREAQYVYDLGTYLDSELSKRYDRNDLTEYEMKKYKYHLLKCNGKFLNVDRYQENKLINSLELKSSDVNNFRLVDLHVDFNPVETNINGNRVSKNRSYFAYKSFVPWLRGSGFRTWAKSLSFASKSAADYLLK